MANKVTMYQPTYLSSLSDFEKNDIKEKVNLELERTNYNTLKKFTIVGALANILAGIFLVWVLYNQIARFTLLTWYVVLVIFNLINIAWSGFFAYRYKNITMTLLKKWHTGLYFIFAALCLTWGSIGILFVPENPYYQFYVVTFLQVVVLSYSFSSIFDFVLAIISNVGLLLPTISFRIYDAINHVTAQGYDPVLNLAFAISFIILGGFLLVVCYIGSRLIISQATLSFLNAALNEKLEDMNKFLEQRVKERTIELEKSLKLVTYQATHDLLTDLPNQRLLFEYIQSAIKATDKNKHLFAVVCFSINEIEKINDGLGHNIGDHVIKTIAKRFQKKFGVKERDADKISDYTVSLSRKDVFVILLNLQSTQEIEIKTQPLFSILDMPLTVEKQMIRLTASIGVSVYPQDGKDETTLLMNADAAMLRAKLDGGNSLSIYNATINADVSKQLELASLLHKAVEKEEFVLQYQPFIDLKTGQISGAEALVRWHHPTLGFIPPINFIPLAEENGIIIPLGEWVLHAACKQVKIWQNLGFNNLKIAVNLSAKQLLQKNILESITEILKQHQLKNEFIELELTETEAFREEVLPVLKQFKVMGLSLSIDDFGTGYSGLSNLKLISIDKLKIDRSFISDVTTNQNSRVIVTNIINLAKSMKITVLAEGVETKGQLDFLLELGCDLIQGYYFSPPVNADVFTELLKSKIKFIVKENQKEVEKDST